MRGEALAVVLLVIGVAAVGCGRGVASGGSSDVSRTGTAMWLRDGPAVVEITGTIRSPGIAGQAQDVRMHGVVDAGARRAHLVIEGDRVHPRERYEDGERVVVSSFLPDTPEPWTSVDGAVLAEVAAAGRLAELDESVNLPYGYFLALSREPSPLTALEALAGADLGQAAGDTVRGVELIRYAVAVPPDAIVAAFGSATSPGLVVDCGRATEWSVWVDGEGRLRRLAYRVDHEALSADVAMAFDPDAAAPSISLPPEDEVFDATAGAHDLLDGPAQHDRTPVPEPCPGGDREPTPVERAACPAVDDGRTEMGPGRSEVGWPLLDARGRRTPNATGRAWFSLAEPTPIDDALALPDGVDLVGVVAVYPDGQGLVGKLNPGVLPPGLGPDALRAHLRDVGRVPGGNPADRLLDPPADPPLAAIRVEGRWAALAEEGSRCAYFSVNPLPLGSPLLSPAVDELG